MKLEYSTIIQIFNLKKDMIHLQHSKECENWKVSHIGADKVIKFLYLSYMHNVNCIHSLARLLI